MGGPGGRPRWEAEGVVPYLKSDFGDFGRLTYQVGKAKIKGPKRRGNGKCILGSIGVNFWIFRREEIIFFIEYCQALWEETLEVGPLVLLQC